MKIAVVAVVVNVILSVILSQSLQHTGLALSVSIAAWLNAALLLIMLRLRGIYAPLKGWFWFLLRTIVAVAVMTTGLLWLNEVNSVWYGWSLFERVQRLLILVAVGALTYFSSLWVLGIRPNQLLLHRPQ